MDYTESTDFFVIAKSDLASSKALFENKYYAQSIFYLQQSIEKLCKALVLDIGYIKFNDLEKKVGHDSSKVFRKILEFQKDTLQSFIKNTDTSSIHDSGSNLNFNPQSTLIDLKNGLSGFDQLMNNKDIFESDEGINDVFEFIDEIVNIEIDIDNNEYNNTNNLVESSFQWIIKLLNIDSSFQQKEIKDLLINPEFKKKFDEIILTVLKILPEILKSCLISMVLGIITYEHAISSRYPIKDKSDIIWNPIALYKEDHYLIKNFKRINYYLEKAIESYETIKKYKAL